MQYEMHLVDIARAGGVMRNAFQDWDELKCLCERDQPRTDACRHQRAVPTDGQRAFFDIRNQSARTRLSCMRARCTRGTGDPAFDHDSRPPPTVSGALKWSLTHHEQ